MVDKNALGKRVADILAEGVAAGIGPSEIIGAAIMALGDLVPGGPPARPGGVASVRGLRAVDALEASEALVRESGHTIEQVTVAMQSADVFDFQRRMAARKKEATA